MFEKIFSSNKKSSNSYSLNNISDKFFIYSFKNNFFWMTAWFIIEIQKKSRLYLFWLKIGFPSRSRPEPLLRRFADRSLAKALSHFLNAKTNKADTDVPIFDLMSNSFKTETYSGIGFWTGLFEMSYRKLDCGGRNNKSLFEE